MRIVVSGTHASGKSTLIADFIAGHAGYEALPDPFELVDAALDEPDAGTYYRQLEIAAARLREYGPGTNVIAERGPLDFLAYLRALDVLGRSGRAAELFNTGYALAADTSDHSDLLVLLPLNPADAIWVPEEEDRELRETMNDVLLELSDDPDLVGDHTRVLEITGGRDQRLTALSTVVSKMAHE